MRKLIALAIALALSLAAAPCTNEPHPDLDEALSTRLLRYGVVQ